MRASVLASLSNSSQPLSLSMLPSYSPLKVVACFCSVGNTARKLFGSNDARKHCLERGTTLNNFVPRSPMPKSCINFAKDDPLSVLCCLKLPTLKIRGVKCSLKGQMLEWMECDGETLPKGGYSYRYRYGITAVPAICPSPVPV